MSGILSRYLIGILSETLVLVARMDLEGPVNVQKLHNAVQLIQQCRDVSESCKLSPYKVVSFNVQLMCAKSSQHAAFLRSSSFIRPVVAGCRHAHLTRISMCRATGGEARSQRDNDRGEADAKHGERLSAGADDYIVNPKHEVSNEEDVSDMRQSSGGGASDASVQAATVQVCDSQKKSRAERHAEDAVLDVTYEVLDEGIPHQGQQVRRTRCAVSFAAADQWTSYDCHQTGSKAPLAVARCIRFYVVKQIVCRLCIGKA